MVIAQTIEAATLEELAQAGQRELEEVARRVEVKPMGPRESGLPTRKIRDGDNDAPAGLENASTLVESLARIAEVLENVPNDDLVEIV